MDIDYNMLTHAQVRKYKEGLKEALSDIPFREQMVSERVKEYHKLRAKMDFPLPSKKPAAVVKKNLYSMLKELYEQIEEDKNIIGESIDTLNHCADELNAMNARKTKNKILQPYEKIDKEEFLNKEIEIAPGYKINTMQLLTPEELYGSGDRFDEVFDCNKEAERRKKAKTKHGMGNV